jgi:CRISPR-associated protein (TIGR02710 family)
MDSGDDRDARDKEIAERKDRYFAILDAQGPKEGAGDGVPPARAYWLAELAERLAERLRERLQAAGNLPDEIGLLVSNAGFSPETTILLARALRPRRVVVISSGEAYGSIDTIGEHLMAHGMKIRDFVHQHCNPVDLSLFEIVRAAVEEHRGKSGQVLIDVTGGKKIMSAAAAMAAWEMDLRIAYTDCKFDDKRRIATPGTEEIILLDSPSKRFGGEEVRRADHDFNSGAYEAARARYERLADRLTAPARARYLRDLAAVYDAWRNLDLPRLQKLVPVMRDRLAESDPLARTLHPSVKAQLDFADRLIGAEPVARAVTLLLLGEANAEAGRHDFAALFFYRTIEASLAGRLVQRYPGFDVGKPDYTLLDHDAAALEARILAAASEIFSTDPKNLAPKLGLMDCAIVLHVVGDDLLQRAGMAGPKGVRDLQSLANIRNQSILAHGFKSVPAKSVEGLKYRARALLKAHWELSGEKQSFDDAETLLRFAKIPT